MKDMLMTRDMLGEDKLPGDKVLAFPVLPLARHPGFLPWGVSVPGPLSCSAHVCLTSMKKTKTNLTCEIVKGLKEWMLFYQ